LAVFGQKLAFKDVECKKWYNMIVCGLNMLWQISGVTNASAGILSERAYDPD